jgi:hypothetical protein
MMKVRVMVPTEVEVKYVSMCLPVKYDDEDMPEDFPGRNGNSWLATVDIDTGIIDRWPVAVSHDLYMKVTDAGSYQLLDASENPIGDLLEDYVPHGVVPGEYGDYVHLQIVEGKITNWPKKPDVSAFFPEHEE